MAPSVHLPITILRKGFIYVSINEIDYTSPAEEFFKEHGLSMILFRQTFTDETGRHKEGDFRLSDGRLIEVIVNVKIDFT